MEDDWEVVEPGRLNEVEPHVRISKHEVATDKHRIYISKGAYEAIGRPSHVQIAISKSNGYRLRLIPCRSTLFNARPVREHKKGSSSHFRMGGGASLVKRYKLPHGNYILGEGNVFTLRQE